MRLLRKKLKQNLLPFLTEECSAPAVISKATDSLLFFIIDRISNRWFRHVSPREGYYSSPSFSKHTEDVSFLDCSSEAPVSLHLLQSDIYKILLFFQPLKLFSANIFNYIFIKLVLWLLFRNTSSIMFYLFEHNFHLLKGIFLPLFTFCYWGI